MLPKVPRFIVGATAVLAIAILAAVPGDANAPQPKDAKAVVKSDAKTAAKPDAKAAAKAVAKPEAKAKGPHLPTPRAGAIEIETAHMARYDAAIAPARGHQISAEDLQRLSDAVIKTAAGDLNAGRQLQNQISDPVARKIVDWYRLKAGYGEPQDYRAFLAANPAWPERALMGQRLEEALFTKGGSARSIKEQLKAEPPRTGPGHAALASALLAEGDEAGARAIAQKVWRELDLAASLEAGFLERFGKLLKEADHKWRLDRFLLEDPRWANERNERAATIRRIIPLLSKPEQQKAEARLAVLLRAKDAQAKLNALPADGKSDWGLAFQRVQLLRRADKDEEAWKILLSAPTDTAQIVNPDAWWVERRVNAYEALKAGKPRMAYDLVRDVGQLSENPLKDQSFMAGWLALRYLGDTRAALAHFQTLKKIADGPLSKARADYWLGRTYDALGDKAQAEQSYRAGSAYIDTFHGQLARARLGGSAKRMDIGPPAAPTAEQIARFNGTDAVRAVIIVRKTKLDSSIARVFLHGLARYFKTESEVAMTAHLAEALGDTQTALRIGKFAISRGYNLITYAYPLHRFPAYTPLRTPPESALLLSVARQESEFNTQTLSGAGARGILQVMPVTARHVCKDYKIKCDIARLMTDPSYNTMMASAYIGDRMGEFAGSYVLGTAGYNAGPGRARQWIREFGDPRDARIDPVDWIHRIPFEETREYVQKVLSNVQVYRARLAPGVSPLRIDEDLVRARGNLAVSDRSMDGTTSQ